MFEKSYVKENGIFLDYLKPVFTGQKSFYKKAKVLKYGCALYLQSYDTIVAKIKDNKFTVYGWYSVTTAIHIIEFLMQHGFDKLSKKEMQKISA